MNKEQDSMDTSLINNANPHSHPPKRSQIQMGWLLFKTFFKFRITSPFYIICLILSIMFLYLTVAIPRSTSRYKASKPTEESYWITNVFRRTYCEEDDGSHRSVFASNSNFNYFRALYPKNQITEDFFHYINQSRYTPGGSCKFSREEFNVEVIGDWDAFMDRVHRFWGFGIEIEEDPKTKEYKLYGYSSYRSMGFDHIYSFFTDFLLHRQGINVDLVVDSASMREKEYSYMQMGAVFLCLLYFFGICFLFYPICQNYLQLHSQKLILLLEISGAHETTVLTSFFVLDFILVFLYSIIMGLIFASHEALIGITPGIAVSTCIATAFALCFQFFFFVPFFKKVNTFRFLILFFLLVNTVIPSIIPLTEAIPSSLSPAAFNAMYIFCPNLATINVFVNAETYLVDHFYYTWADMKTPVYLVDAKRAHDCLWGSAFLYFILWVLSNSLCPRENGSPPIGMKNLFSLRFWKSFFRKRQDFSQMNLVTGTPVIEVENISKTYHGQVLTRALQEVSFTVNVGEVIILIGPNGCGKSTLINSMTGTIQADEGHLKLFDQDAAGFNAMQDYVGICFQENIFFPTLSVKEHLKLFGALRGADDNSIEQDINLFKDELQLQDCLSTRAGECSGGQKRKLCIALAFVGSPPIVILDEPTSGIDASSRQMIWKTVSGFSTTTSFVSSHALEEAEAVSSRLFVMTDGKLVFTGKAGELRQKYHCGYIFKCVGQNPNRDQILQRMKTILPDAKIHDSREDMIVLPVDPKIVDILSDVDDHLAELGLESYTLTAEALEDVILKIIANSQ